MLLGYFSYKILKSHSKERSYENKLKDANVVVEVVVIIIIIIIIITIITIITKDS